MWQPDPALHRSARHRRVQVLQALRACHRTGIVHRDIKPQNVIMAEQERRIKLIDLGAAADLRVGINYVPNEFLLDPRYAPPEQYIMSTQVRSRLMQLPLSLPPLLGKSWCVLAGPAARHTPLERSIMHVHAMLVPFFDINTLDHVIQV